MDNQPSNPKQALLDRLNTATNILVTVSTNPSVDELASCLGLTLWLNKIGKHATAVFSGEVPSTLEFLQPAQTLEKNTDSLRDFIISLDKSKADKLRYKVEDSVVKIFITPYRTSLSADDLEYSQGDFNVDMVIALGVSSQQDLDSAITSHGRILHDATVATITTGTASELGSINWNDAQTSSLSELVTDLGNIIGKDHLDGQIATALLTGVVAETDRFSNEKTTPQTMSVSAELMSAGANQQLVASKLQPAASATEITTTESHEAPIDQPPAGGQDGTIEIEHEEQSEPEEEPMAEALPEPVAEEPVETAPEEEMPQDVPTDTPESAAHSGSKLVTEPPTMGGTLTANSRPDDIMLEPSSDPLTNASEQPLMSRDNEQPIVPTDQPDLPMPTPAADFTGLPDETTDQPVDQAFTPPVPAPPSWMPPQPWMDNQPPAAPVASPQFDLPSPPAAPEPEQDNPTLTEIEQSVESPHVEQAAASDAPANLDSARDEVMRALESSSTPLEPVQALNANPIDLNPPVSDQPVAESSELPLPTPNFPDRQFDPSSFDITNDAHDAPAEPALNEPTPVDPDLVTPVDQPYTMPLPAALAPPAANPIPPTSVSDDPSAPPPVPPPLMPPGFPPNQ